MSVVKDPETRLLILTLILFSVLFGTRIKCLLFLRRHSKAYIHSSALLDHISLDRMVLNLGITFRPLTAANSSLTRMSGPYRPPRYRRGASGSRHRQWVRGQESLPQPQTQYPSAYNDSAHYGYQGYQGYDAQYQQNHTYGGYSGYQHGGYYESYPREYYQQQVGYQDPYYGGAQGYAQGYERWGDGRAQEWRGSGSGYTRDAQGHPPHRNGAVRGADWRNPAPAPAPAPGSAAVKGAPEAPKKMRQAAQRSQYRYNQHHSSSSSSPYYQQGQQQRDYHSSSRYQPYTRHDTSDHHMSTSRFLAPSIRSSPRDSYILQATQPSHTLSEDEAEARKLLVILDLNGTLVFRAKRENRRAVDSVRAVPRPYLLCFLRWCLGNPSPSTTSPPAFNSSTDQGKEGGQGKPHGSHHWSNPIEPSSQGHAEVVIWSSAQPLNVDSMLKASFDSSLRAQLKRVWARDTLVPNRLFGLKAESVKDLEIVWAELNAFANNKPSPGRLLAEIRDKLDRQRPDDALPTSPSKNRGKGRKQGEKEGKGISAALEAAIQAEELGPWGAHNTVLVDDSVAKARLQPYNQLVIPEFGKRDAGMMRKYILQQLPSEAEGEAEGDLEYDSDLSIPEDKIQPASNAGEADADETMQEEESKEKKPKKPIPESRLDDVLLQTIGVLSILRFQSNVSSFIRSGGIKGYGEAKTAQNDKQRQEKIEQGNTPEYWAQKGREACEQAGIEVKAWVPGEAASATAALL